MCRFVRRILRSWIRRIGRKIEDLGLRLHTGNIYVCIYIYMCVYIYIY